MFNVVPGKSVLVVVSHDKDEIALTWSEIETQAKLIAAEYIT